MDQDDDLPSAAVDPGPSAGPLDPGYATAAAAVAAAAGAAVQRPTLGIPPDLDLGGDHERCTMFEPALYIQRYTTVCQLLADTQRFGVVSKVLDIGCAEMTFLQFLKSVPSLTDISLLDISEDTLRRSLRRATPGARDRLERRLQPLRVRVFCGDVTQPDTRLLGCDAITGIEVIEHLEPAVLRAVPAAVFGFLRPRLVVLTTPNAEFNQLFPDFSGMRHWDHKFEWTRAEFQQWGDSVVAEYPEYEVSYEGIGPPPAGSEHLGCCSQMAVFCRRGEPAATASASSASTSFASASDSSSTASAFASASDSSSAASAFASASDSSAAAADSADPPAQQPQPHRLLSDFEFPFETREERLYSDVLYYTRQIGDERMERALQPRREELIPLQMIAAYPAVATRLTSLDELVALLNVRGMPVVVRGGEPHVVYRAPAEASGSEDELAGGDLRSAEDGVGREDVPAGADSAAGDATYHDDWDNEPDWEQEIMESRSWDSHAGCDWAAPPDLGRESSDPSVTPWPSYDTPPTDTRHSGSDRHLPSVLTAYRLLLELLHICFPASWTAPLVAALLPSIVAELNLR